MHNTVLNIIKYDFDEIIPCTCLFHNQEMKEDHNKKIKGNANTNNVKLIHICSRFKLADLVRT